MQYEALCKEVEQQLQFKPKARTDFDYLSEKILAKTHETLSPNTLMRLWGYRESVNARRSTLDILSRFVGSEDYAHFVKERGLGEEEPPKPIDPPQPKTHPSPLDPPQPSLKGEEIGQSAQSSQSSQNAQNSQKAPSLPISPIRAGGLLLLAVLLGLAVWHFFLRSPLEEGLPAGSKNMTHLLSNPTCDTDKLDAWTFEHGGVTLAVDSTLTYYMKRFDVYQVVRGLPAGEYELRVNAWQLPDDHDVAMNNYEQAEDKEDGCWGTEVEVYAGPFAKRVKNKCSETEGNLDNALRFVVLDDSVRIGVRSDANFRRSSLAVADNFRLFLVRKAKSDAELQALTAKRDSALAADKVRLEQKEHGYSLKTHHIEDAWKGYETPLPEGWETEQDTSRCHVVHKRDVGHGFGDSEIYLEYLSDEPAKPGMLIGQRILLEPGKYSVGACVFAQDKRGDVTSVVFAVAGTEGVAGSTSMMDYRFVHFTLSEPKEVTIGLWAPEGCNVRRAGICMPGIWKE